MTVAAEIKAIARELGVSQGLLARQARMSRASLSLKLNGRRDMTLSEVERLAARDPGQSVGGDHHAGSPRRLGRG